MANPAIKVRERRFAVAPSASVLARAEKLNRIDGAHTPNGNVMRMEAAFESLLEDIEAAIQPCVWPTPDGRALVMTAPSFSGKSHVLDRLEADDRLCLCEQGGVQTRPFLKVVVPSPCNLKALGLAFLSAMGADTRRQLTDVFLIWHAVRRQLIAQGVLLILLDEFQNILVGKNLLELDKLAAALKAMLVGEPIVPPPEDTDARVQRAVADSSERYPVFLLIAGTPVIGKFAADFSNEHREQFSRRCHEIAFAKIPWIRSGDSSSGSASGTSEFRGLLKFINALLSAMDVQVDPTLLEADGLKRFYKAGSRHFGRVAHLLKQAAKLAVKQGRGLIAREHLAQAFETIYRTGPDRNCFLVPDIDACPFPPGPEDEEKSRSRKAAA
jgi:hypothetical protein